MGEETPEKTEKAKDYAKPMFKVIDPVSLGLFGGCIDHKELTEFFGQSMKSVPEQDRRGWDRIRALGREPLVKLINQL